MPNTGEGAQQRQAQPLCVTGTQSSPSPLSFYAYHGLFLKWEGRCFPNNSATYIARIYMQTTVTVLLCCTILVVWSKSIVIYGANRGRPQKPSGWSILSQLSSTAYQWGLGIALYSKPCLTSFFSPPPWNSITINTYYCIYLCLLLDTRPLPSVPRILHPPSGVAPQLPM